MLRINPKLASQPCVPKAAYTIPENPLQMLWKSHNKTHGNYVDDMSKMDLLLRFSFTRKVDEGNENDNGDDDDGNNYFRHLIAACSIRCPRDYMSYILTEYRHQIREVDIHARLPLHYVTHNAEEDSPGYTQFVIEYLVAEYPYAAAVHETTKDNDTDEKNNDDDDASGGGAKVLSLHRLIGDKSMTWHKSGVMALGMVT